MTQIENIALILFSGATFLIALTYVGYPLLVYFLGSLLPARNQKNLTEGAHPRGASIIICAYNEEAVIEEKIRTVIAQTYSADFEIVVANDGSNDRTSELARRVEDIRIKILDFDRRGKAAALNDAVAVAAHDILVFTDADTLWTPETLAALMRPFSAPNVGCVAGNVISKKKQKNSAAAFDRVFRLYENTIRSAENNLAGCVSADGGLYAIRKSLFEPAPSGVTDDFFISTGVVAKGKHIEFEPNAIVYENAIASGKSNFRRRVRITVRGLTSLWKRASLFNPFKYGFYSVALFFHKFMRRFAAVLLVTLFPLSILLIGLHPLFMLLAFGQLLLYLSVGAYWLTGYSVAGLGKITMTALHIIGLAMGFILFIAGKRFHHWSPQRNG